MEEATVNFKAYKAERVIRYRNAPLLPANLFSGVVIGGFLGWVLRRHSLRAHILASCWWWHGSWRGARPPTASSLLLLRLYSDYYFFVLVEPLFYDQYPPHYLLLSLL